jgi:nitric oxide reductase NorQ protein
MARLGELSRTTRDYLWEHRTEQHTVNELHAEVTRIRGTTTSAGAVRKAVKALQADGLVRQAGRSPITYIWDAGAPRPADYRPTGSTKIPYIPPVAPVVSGTPSGTAKGQTPVTDQRAVLRGMLKDKLDDLTGERKEKAEAAAPPKPPKRPKRPSVKRPNGQMYYPRELGGKTDIERLHELRGRFIPALLAGPPGTGKTALVEAAFGQELFVVTGDENTSVDDFMGQWSPTGKADEYTWVDGPLVDAMKAGGVLFIDDATLISPKVLAAVYPAMDGRGEVVVKDHMVNGKREVVKAAPGFYVAAAHNPGVHGAILTDAMSSRFIAQIYVETDMELAATLGVPEKMLKLVRNLRTERDKNDSGLWIPQLREQLAFRDIAKVMGEEAAAANLLGVTPEGPDRDVVASKMRVIWGRDIQRLTLGGQM